MPYIALQLVGMERVIQALGFHGEGIFSHLPLTIAFVILALYTYSSGLRAPAMIAFVKDTMIYIFVIAAVIYIPTQLGGYGAIFDAAGAALDKKAAASGGKIAAGLILKPAQVMPFITLAIGSAMALFLYPHSMTGILAASTGNAIRRNAIALPAYSLVLGLIALMGYMAHAAGIQVANPQDAVPQLFLKMFPSWFAGFTFAAIAIGALVPAAVMSIGAANTFTRNFWKAFVDPNLSPARRGRAREGRLADRQARRLAHPLRHADAIRHRFAAPRRRVDDPDLPGADLRPLHALVHRPRLARRLGRRHDPRDLALLGRDQLDAGQQLLRLAQLQ